MDAHNSRSATLSEHTGKPPKRMDILEIVVIVLLVSAASSTFLWDSGLAESVRGLVGLVALVLAIAHINLPSPVRIGLTVFGIFILAASGWLDFEGWRFLPPRGSLGGSP